MVGRSNRPGPTSLENTSSLEFSLFLTAYTRTRFEPSQRSMNIRGFHVEGDTRINHIGRTLSFLAALSNLKKGFCEGGVHQKSLLTLALTASTRYLAALSCSENQKVGIDSEKSWCEFQVLRCQLVGQIQQTKVQFFLVIARFLQVNAGYLAILKSNNSVAMVLQENFYGLIRK